MSRSIVLSTPELKRIVALERRAKPWEQIFVDAVCTRLTARLKRPTGKITLLPVQAAGLVELHDFGGWFGQAGVGSGKTLITLLAPTIVNAQRPILFVPSKLLGKTQREFQLYDQHFDLIAPTFAKYEILSRVGGAEELLYRLEPDLIVLDEAHKCKATTSACTRKLRNYIRERRAAGHRLHVVACSGTFAKRSIEDFYHIAHWCHPERTPLPHLTGERLLWSKALDEGIPEHQRVNPGALRAFSDLVEGITNDLERARVGVQRRIFETPGFLATKSNDVADCSLTIECVQIPVPKEVDALFHEVKEEWRKPSHEGVEGDQLQSAAEQWATSRGLACGLYHYWKEPGPPWWRAPRRAYFKGVRKELHYSKKLNSPDEVRRKILEVGEKHHLWQKYQAWHAVEHKFKPQPRVRFVHDFALDYVADWAKKNDGLIWVEWPDFGERIAKRLGIKYYGRGGLASDGSFIEAASKSERVAVASIDANFEGRNLQEGIWHKMLFTSAPPTGTKNEQAIAREHRRGQKADEVEVTYMIACLEQYNGFFTAMRDAGFHNAIFGSDMKMHGAKSADVILPDWKMLGWAWREPVRESEDDEDDLDIFLA